MKLNLIVSSLCAVGAFAEFFSKNGLIYDEAGRVNIFHGTNFVQKGPPWYPEVLLDENHIKQMAGWGFNTIRLGVMWTGVNPQKGVFNETYIEVIGGILNTLEKYGINALIDVHQDVLSTYFCLYDGAPTWAVDLTNSSVKNPFPWPLAWDGTNPCPYERGWSQNYFAEATGVAFQGLYDNNNGMRDYFGQFWTKVVTSFKSNNILGYEIINEPWAGDIYTKPSLLLPGIAGKDNLQPFYHEIQKFIRAVDTKHMIFYEPVTWGMIFNGTLTGSGFTEVPGGADWTNKSVFSFHYYCWWYGNGKEFNRFTCDKKFGPKVFDQVKEDVRVLGGAAMLTEWGQGCQFESNSTGECDPIMDLADSRLMSWIDWYWSGPLLEGWQPTDDAIATYSRTFAQKIAGNPTKMKFDADSLRFELCYTPDSSITEPTIIFVNNAVHYTSGVNVIVTGDNASDFAVTVGEAETNRIFVQYTGSASATGLSDVCVLVTSKKL